VDVLED
jgi:hypothetical protein